MATSKCGTQPMPPTPIQEPEYDTRCCNNGKSVLLGGKPWCPIGCSTQEENNRKTKEEYQVRLDAYNRLVDGFINQDNQYKACVASEVQTGVRNPDGSINKGLSSASDNSIFYIAIGAVVLLLIVFVVIRMINR